MSVRRRFAVLALAAGACLAVACGPEQTPSEAYQDWVLANHPKLSSEKRVKAARRFLHRHPDTTYTFTVASSAVQVLSGELGDPAGADELLVELLDEVKTPETRKALMQVRLGLLARRKDRGALRAVAAEVAGGAGARFGDHEAVLAAAVAAEDWALALEHADRALSFATAEAFRKELAGRPVRESVANSVVRRRRTVALGARGWALANTGRLDEGVAALREAYEADVHGYLGDTEMNTGRFLGQALAGAGKREEALDLLATEALFGNDRDAEAALKRLWLAGGGREDGWGAWLHGERLRRARKLDDVELADASGARRKLSAMRNGEVMFLAFWTPT